MPRSHADPSQIRLGVVADPQPRKIFALKQPLHHNVERHVAQNILVQFFVYLDSTVAEVVEILSSALVPDELQISF